MIVLSLSSFCFLTCRDPSFASFPSSRSRILSLAQSKATGSASFEASSTAISKDLGMPFTAPLTVIPFENESPDGKRAKRVTGLPKKMAGNEGAWTGSGIPHSMTASMSPVWPTLLKILSTFGSIRSPGKMNSEAPPVALASPFMKYSLQPAPIPIAKTFRVPRCSLTRSKICCSLPTSPSVRRMISRWDALLCFLEEQMCFKGTNISVPPRSASAF